MTVSVTRVFLFSCSVVILLSCLFSCTEGGVRSSIRGFIAGKKWKKWLNHPSDARFKIGLGSALQASPGDTVVISIYLPSTTVKRPWHWFYTIAPGKMLRFQPNQDQLLTEHVVHPKEFDPAKRYPHYYLMNREKKPGHIGLVGSLVAHLMAASGKNLYFHFLFCSAKHYIEYLSLGVVDGGRWYKLLYNNVSRRCPVREKLTSEMIHEIYKSKKFTLKAKNGNTVDLKVDDWPADIKALYGKAKPPT